MTASTEPKTSGPAGITIQHGSVFPAGVPTPDEEVTSLLEESRSRREAAGRVRK